MPKSYLREYRPQREHTEIEEELHEIAHIDYDRVSIVSDQKAHVPQENAKMLVDCQSLSRCSVRGRLGI